MMNERKFSQIKPSHNKPSPDSEFAPDENFYKKQENEEHEAGEELKREIHEKIEKDRLARSQIILVNNKQLKELKEKGQLNIPGVKLYGRELIKDEKVIISGEDKNIEAWFDEIVSDPNKPNPSGTITILVHLIK